MKKYLLIALALLVAACEKPVFDEDIVSMKEANVILHMMQYEQESFGTRAATDITELCSRLNVAIFDADGTKVKTVAQKEGDASYGTVALTLAAGTYQLVVIAHNGEGSATIRPGCDLRSAVLRPHTDPRSRHVPLGADRRGNPIHSDKVQVLLHWRFFDFQSLGWLRLRQLEAD